MESFKTRATCVAASTIHPEGQLPPWINLELAKMGTKFANDYFFPVLQSHLYALALEAYQDGMQILAFTGNSFHAGHSHKRYTATAIQIVLWYKTLFTEKNDLGLKR